MAQLCAINGFHWRKDNEDQAATIYDAGPIADVGAVYLYDGATGALISALTGSTAGDQVGTWVDLLTNGNYVVSSPYWDNAAVIDAGAVTWGYRTGGTTGPITAENSVLGIAENGGRSDDSYLTVSGIWHGKRDPTQFKVKSRINRRGRPVHLQAVPVCSPA